MGLVPSILISSVFCFLLPAVIFKQNLDFSEGTIITISTSTQYVYVGPKNQMMMGRTADENDLVTTARTHEHRHKRRNSESSAHPLSLAMIVGAMVVRGKNEAGTW